MSRLRRIALGLSASVVACYRGGPAPTALVEPQPPPPPRAEPRIGLPVVVDDCSSTTSEPCASLYVDDTTQEAREPGCAIAGTVELRHQFSIDDHVRCALVIDAGATRSIVFPGMYCWVRGLGRVAALGEARCVGDELVLELQGGAELEVERSTTRIRCRSGAGLTCDRTPPSAPRDPGLADALRSLRGAVRAGNWPAIIAMAPPEHVGGLRSYLDGNDARVAADLLGVPWQSLDVAGNGDRELTTTDLSAIDRIDVSDVVGTDPARVLGWFRVRGGQDLPLALTMYRAPGGTYTLGAETASVAP